MIELRDICQYFGSRQVLADVSFVVPRGAVCGLLGQNGAGKSTLLKILAGIDQPTSGFAAIDGMSVGTNANQVKAIVGYVPEAPVFFEYLTGEEYLAMVSVLHKLEPGQARMAVGLALERFGLSLVRAGRIHLYSKGMRQRLALAASVVHEPKVLILDEPFTALDADGRLLLEQMIVDSSARLERTVLIVSHERQIISRLCSMVIPLHAGKVAPQS